MNEGLLIATARRRAGLSLRDLAERVGTSHATLSAYEQGHKVPSSETLDRVLRGAGSSAMVVSGRRVFSGPEREQELKDVLELAAQFPARHNERLTYPLFPRTKR